MPDVHTPENHVADLHVALLLNFIAPNHSHVLREIAGRVRRLTVIASTPLEDNRQWQTDHDGLDVIVQRTWTLRRRLKHVMGFREQNYLHVPLDTRRQLRRLSPDVVASTELGPRTFAAKRYCNANSVPHMVCVNDSRHSETSQSWVRRWLRRYLLKDAAGVTYNGPACQELLLRYGASPEVLKPWYYAADPDKIYLGALREPTMPGKGCLRLLTIGALTPRKGLQLALQRMLQWLDQHRDAKIHWRIAGTGQQRSPMQEALDQRSDDRMRVQWLGHQTPEQLQNLYATSDVMLFPTLSDEWGLVVDEAMASGVAVIASTGSQAATTLIRDGENGFLFSCFDSRSSDNAGATCGLHSALDRWHAMNAQQRITMRQAARRAMRGRGTSDSAMQFMDAVRFVAAASRRDAG